MPKTIDEVPKQPTPEQCAAMEQVEPGRWAVWYPQMGGYVAMAVVQPAGGCFHVWIWHDGDFPLSENDGGRPASLHHCDPLQFIEFGKKVAALPGMEIE